MRVLTTTCTLWMRMEHHFCNQSWNERLLVEPNTGILYFPSFGTEAVYLYQNTNITTRINEYYAYVEFKWGLRTSRTSSCNSDQTRPPSLRYRNFNAHSTWLDIVTAHLSSSEFAQSNNDKSSWIANAQQSYSKLPITMKFFIYMPVIACDLVLIAAR